MNNVPPTSDDRNPPPANPNAAPSALPHTQAGLPGKLPPLDAGSPGLLARLERQLRSGKTSQSTKAIALATIKAQGLARLNGLSFPAYCDERLRLQRSRVYQLLEFAELLEATAASGTLPPAENERQLRPLKKLASGDWQAA